MFFLCLIISASFWLVTALRDTFESEIDVPLQLNGVPETVRITTPLPEVVHVAVRDKGTTLVGYHWRLRAMRPVMLDFQDYDNGAVSGRGQVPQGDVLRVVQHQLDGTIDTCRDEIQRQLQIILALALVEVKVLIAYD